MVPLDEASKESFFNWFFMPHLLVVIFALLLIMAVPYFVWQHKVQQEIFADRITHYNRIIQGIADTAEVDHSQTPAARLIDLNPWGYRVLARQSREVRD